MKSQNLESISCDEISDDIFGVSDSEQTQLGLVNAIDPTDFASKLSALEGRWNRLWPAQVLSQCFSQNFMIGL